MKSVNGARVGLCVNQVYSKISGKLTENYENQFKADVKNLYRIVEEIEEELKDGN